MVDPERARRIVQAADPEAVESLNRAAASASKLISQSIGTSRFASAIARINANALAGIKVMPKIDLPIVRVDYSSMFPEINRINETVMKSVAPMLAELNKSYSSQFADIAKNLQKIAVRAYPENWRHGSGLVEFPDNLEQILIDEGIPLAWVPPTRVLEKLFAAETAGKRRQVLSSNWKTIVDECVVVLKSVEEEQLGVYVEFGLEAAEALADGKWKASQALSANILDSFLHQKFTPESRKALTDQKQRVEWKKFPMRVALVVGALSGGYSEYWPKNGDEIPKQFSRHASAHGLSRRQYSRLNAVIALMNVVGLIKVSETDLYRWDDTEAEA